MSSLMERQRDPPRNDYPVIAIRGADAAASNAAMGAFGARTPMRFVSSRENKRSDPSIQDTAA
mgnify:CR=1 FL=1